VTDRVSCRLRTLGRRAGRAAAILGVLAGGLTAGLGARAADNSVNRGWRFLRLEARPDWSDAAGPERVAFDDSSWESVALPHSARLEPPTHGPDYFKGVCWYRRTIAASPAWRGKRVSIVFDGAMQAADVWVNGTHVLTHLGGYLPFVVDLTDAFRGGRQAAVALRLDNRASDRFPPGSDRIDFAYYGGLYRAARLVVTDPVHVTDPIAADRVAGGGVFVRYEHVGTGTADVLVQVNVRNDEGALRAVSVEHRLLDPDGQLAATAVSPAQRLQPGASSDFSSRLVVRGPRLWHPDHPWLYRLVTVVKKDGAECDRQATRCGIRHLAYTNDGFFLNGEKLVIRGANRHMSFPWLGNAASDNLQYRDIRLLKEAGFNFVRLAHYPQSTAVMDACDELGVLALVCTPGWQFFGDNESFRREARQNIREMIRWHRNHASAVLWEVSLNETYRHDDFYAGSVAVAREEYPGGQLFTSGDSHSSKSVRHYDVTYTEWGDFYNRPLNPDARIAKGLHREYGDYEFGGQQSTTRVPRGGGEERLLLQAWNFQWSHNRNLSWPWTIGDAIWAGIDNASTFDRLDALGRGDGSWWGPLDLFRLPKFSYFFYQSQRAPETRLPFADSGPMVKVAGYWTPRASPTKVVVYSNADEVELRLNGRRLARQPPDSGPDTEYGQPPVPFDGGNCRHLDHAPFTYSGVAYETGELKAVAYWQGKPVAADTLRTPGRPAALRLRAPTLGRALVADGSDALFVYAEIVDEAGQVVPDATMPVRFRLAGSGRLVGPAEVRAEAGIAAALMQAGTIPGALRLAAASEGLRPAEIVVQSLAERR
jgi:beta-galactosidase